MLLNQYSLPENPDRISREAIANHIKYFHGHSIADTFFLFGGIGDPVLWLSLLPAYRNKLNKPITLVIPSGAESIPMMYKGRAFDEIILATDYIDPKTFFAREYKLKENERIAHHVYYGDANLKEYSFACQVSGLSNIDMIKSLLGLPLETITARPLPTSNSMLKAANLFQELKLPVGRTVLIAPIANSYPHKISEFWWEECVASLIRAGFAVVNNVENRSHFSPISPQNQIIEFKGAKSVHIPVDTIIPFTELCGNFIGIRSGLCDLMAYANAKKIIVYPQPNPNAQNYAWVRSVAHYWSLNRNYDCDNLWEYLIDEQNVFDKGLVDELIEALD